MKRLGRVTTRILDLETTLMCGQTFTFKHFKKPPSNSFVGVFGNHVIELTNNHHHQSDDDVNNSSSSSSNDNPIYYRKLNPIIVADNQQSSSTSSTRSLSNEESDEVEVVEVEEVEQLISNYFQINSYDIEALHSHFATVDPELFGKIVQYYGGWRLLKMEPLETLFSFICSSNNNVQRITKMVQVLCEKYGEYLGEFTIDDGVTRFPMYKFPTLEQLEDCTEKELKEHNFGYRAKYIVQTVAKLKKMPKNYLYNLSNKETYPKSLDVLNQLKQFSGVGMKVASCVALYSMDRHDCVPTDVHILRIARNCYPSMRSIISKKKKKSLTEKEVQKVMNEFVNIFGEYAGLAQMILYGSQLSQFKTRIPEKVRETLIKANAEEEEESSEEETPESSEEESSEEKPIIQEQKKRRIVRRTNK